MVDLPTTEIIEPFFAGKIKMDTCLRTVLSFEKIENL